MKIRIFYVPFPNQESANAVISALISNKLIACGNVMDAQSSYLWSGQVCNETEAIAILKSIDAKKDDIQAMVNELHTYEVPAIVSWLVDCNPAYQDWIISQVS